MTQQGGFPPPGQAYPPPGGDASPDGPTAYPHHPAGAAAAYPPAAGGAPGYPPAPAAAYPSGPAAGYGLPMLHKPGIVALRPLGLGDLLDGSIKAIRRNPGATLGLSVLVSLVCLIPSAALAAVLTTVAFDGSDWSTASGSLGTMPASVVQLLFTQLATGLLSGMLVHVIGEAVLGRHSTMGRTWSATRRRLLPVLGAQVLVGMAVLLPVAIAGGGVALAVAGTPEVGVPVAILGGLACIVLGLWLGVRTCMSAPAIVLEGLGVRAGLRRSFALTGGAFWRTFGILLLVSVMASVAASMLQVPFSIVGVGAAVVSGDTLSTLLVLVFVSHLGQLFSGALTTPFVAGVTGLLYIDRRIRLEGLDVTLIRAAQSDAATRQG